MQPHGRIDAHQHFWIYNDTDYVWMGPRHERLRRDFVPADLAPLLDAVGFDGSIAVQARQTVEETSWLLELAASESRISGVVGWLDLCSERISAQIERYAGEAKLRGVRHVVHDEPDDDFMLRPEFLRGLGMLEPAGLTYDFLLFPRHIRRAIAVADRLPHQPFVVDHIAKPPIADGAIEPWRRDLRELARRENVCCKLSGMVTEAGADWRPDDLTPYLDAVLEAFGTQRVMIGSDWPVCTLAGDYRSVMNVVLDYVASLSESETAAIAGGNCARFYGV